MRRDRSDLLATLTLIILLYINISQAKFGRREDLTFTTERGWNMADFLLIKDEAVLIVAESYTTSAQMYVIDVSGETMTVISDNTYICTEAPFLFDRFVYINATHFYIECQYIRGGIVTNKVSIAYIDATNNEIIEVEGEGRLYPGSLFPIQIPPNYPTFWFYGEESRKASIIGLESTKQWSNTSMIDLQVPTYGYESQQGGFISADGSYLVCSAYPSTSDDVPPIWKISVPDGQVIASITNPITANPSDRSYTFIDYSTSMSIILSQGDINGGSELLNITYTAYDFNSMQQLANPLLLQFPYTAIYSYITPWTIASFADGYFYVVLSVDRFNNSKYFQVLQQFQMPSASSPELKLVDHVSTLYDYNHNLIATKDWVYLDTGSATISRWSV